MVGLLPKMVFGEGAVIPTIRNNAMLAWRYASEVCGLCCTGNSRKNRAYRSKRGFTYKSGDLRRMFSDKTRREANDVKKGVRAMSMV